MKNSLTIYHNQKCSKSRETMALLKELGADTDVVNYLETPPSPSELDQLLKQLGLEPEDIVRKKEDRYDELNLKTNPPKDRDGWLKVLTENPILIERPIVTNGTKAVIGRPPEKVRELIQPGVSR